MKSIQIVLGWQVERLQIPDNAKADKAYAEFVAAMGAYEQFRNDKAKTVTIDHGTGTSTFRIENLVAVSIDDMEASEETMVAIHAFNNKVKARAKELAMPAGE